MELRDVLVAAVAMGLGGMMLFTAITDQGWCYQMKIARVIEEAKGREKARTFIGTVGSLLILLSLYILLAPTIAATWFQSIDQSSPRTGQTSGAMRFADID